jgi:two-component system NtrC family sensor kinase
MPRRLGPKLIISLSLLVLVIGGASGYLGLRAQKRHLVRAMIMGADQLSQSITSATWSAMQADRRADVYQIVDSIAERQGVQRIRMFDRQGTLVFPRDTPETGKAVPMEDAACRSCHRSQPPLARLSPNQRIRIEEAPGGKTLSMVTPIFNEPACSNGSCHAHSPEQKVLGVLDVSLSLDPLESQSRSMTVQTVASTLALVLLGAGFIVFSTRRFVANPIRELIQGTQKLSQLDLDQPLHITNRSEELDQLVDSFNLMRERLRRAISDLNEMARALQDKVAERTQQLETAEARLVRVDQLASLDRLASLGQLAASVAHEINNPLSGILNLSVLLERIVRADGIPKGREDEVRKHLGQISLQTERVARIVTNLLAFSRQQRPQRAPADLNQLVQAAFTLVSHKLQLMEAKPQMELDAGLPQVECDAGQIQQVILNLTMNAAESMQAKGGGTLFVRTRLLADRGLAELSVQDTGEGIPTEYLSKIFEPFFTTKSDGKGVGLGLALVYGIVKEHGGDVEVRSQRDVGTTFTVTLPTGTGEAS